MKIMNVTKSIIFLVTKLPVISSFLLMASITSIAKVISYEMQLSIVCVCMILPIVVYWLMFDEIEKTSFPFRSINNVLGTILVALGIFLMYDIKNRPNQYSESKSFTTTITKDSTAILEGENYRTLIYKNVKFDSINPLKVYKTYKIDIFGDTINLGICVKGKSDYQHYSPNQ